MKGPGKCRPGTLDEAARGSGAANPNSAAGNGEGVAGIGDPFGFLRPDQVYCEAAASASTMPEPKYDVFPGPPLHGTRLGLAGSGQLIGAADRSTAADTAPGLQFG
jgi:hypothetical protein